MHWDMKFLSLVDLRNMKALKVGIAIIDNHTPNHLAFKLVEDTTGGAELTTLSGAPLRSGDVLDLQPNGSTIRGDSDTATDFLIGFGAGSGQVTLQFTSDRADNDVRNGITDEYTDVWIHVPNPPAFFWNVGPVVTTTAGANLSLKYEVFGAGVPWFWMTEALSTPSPCVTEGVDVKGAGFIWSKENDSFKVPDSLAPGDYPIDLTTTCSHAGNTSEAKYTTTVRVTR